MKPRWSAVETCLLLLSFSVCIAICEPMLIRFATGQPLSDNAANVLNTFTQSIGVGILSIAAMILGKKWKDDEK